MLMYDDTYAVEVWDEVTVFIGDTPHTRGTWRLAFKFDKACMAKVIDAVIVLSGAIPGSKWCVVNRDGAKRWVCGNGVITEHYIQLPVSEDES